MIGIINKISGHGLQLFAAISRVGEMKNWNSWHVSLLLPFLHTKGHRIALVLLCDMLVMKSWRREGLLQSPRHIHYLTSKNLRSKVEKFSRKEVR